MNDGIMYTFDVLAHHSHGIAILFRCARKDTAEYLRDWCEADEMNRYHDTLKHLLSEGFRTEFVDRMRNSMDKYSVGESEVIL